MCRDGTMMHGAARIRTLNMLSTDLSSNSCQDQFHIMPNDHNLRIISQWLSLYRKNLLMQNPCAKPLREFYGPEPGQFSDVLQIIASTEDDLLLDVRESDICRPPEASRQGAAGVFR